LVDLSSNLLAGYHSYRLPSLDLGDDVIFPQYGSLSLVNLPASICRWLGVPDFGTGPLAPDLMSVLDRRFRCVVVLVVDGLGYDHIRHLLDQGCAEVWRKMLPQAVFAPLTSTVPSTTSTALTTLWTGTSAAGHGITGYEMWLKEYGVVANMILHSPASFSGDVGSLRRAGFQPESFMPLPTLGSWLARHGIVTQAYLHHSIARSGLSMMHFPQVETRAFLSISDLWISLGQQLNAYPDQRAYYYAYWGGVDEMGHYFGPDDERVSLDFDQFSRSFEQAFLNKLTPSARQDTLFILTSDHGMVPTPKNADYDLRHHPRLCNWLHIQPCGENRLAYLYVRPGKLDAVREYMTQNWPDRFYIRHLQQVIDAGLFGSQPVYPPLYDRLGDLICIARGDAYLWWSGKENHLLGRHGGLSRTEMLVPFLAFSL